MATAAATPGLAAGQRGIPSLNVFEAFATALRGWPDAPPSAPGPPLLALRTLKRRFRQAIEWVWRQEGSHGQRARGLAAGVFMGCFPIFGFQTVLGVALASLVRGNHLLAAAGTWISNPITDIPLIWFNYQLGSLLLGPGRGWPGRLTLHHETLRQLGWDFTSRLLLGSAVVGVVAATLSGFLCLRWLERRQRAS